MSDTMPWPSRPAHEPGLGVEPVGAGFQLVVRHHRSRRKTGNARESLEIEQRVHRLAGLLTRRRVLGRPESQRHRRDVQRGPQAVVVAHVKMCPLRHVAGEFQVDRGDIAATVMPLLNDAVKVRRLLSERCRPVFNTRYSRLRLDPGAARLCPSRWPARHCQAATACPRNSGIGRLAAARRLRASLPRRLHCSQGEDN